MTRLTPGALISYFQVAPGHSSFGKWVKARVKNMSATRVVITLEHPESGEKPHRAVSTDNVEIGWTAVERYALKATFVRAPKAEKNRSART